MSVASRDSPRISGVRLLWAAAPRQTLPGRCAKPMLATGGLMPQRLGEFAYEVKWDGYRALAQWDGTTFRLCSRNGIDLGPRFPEITAMRRRLRHPLLVDGEIVAMDSDGRPSFSALQSRMPGLRGVRSSRIWDAKRYRVQYMIFDILHYQGRTLCSLPYTDRRRVLESLHLKGPAWQTPPAHPDGVELLRVMKQTGQEGIIAKRLTSRYVIGLRSRDWIKIKIHQREEFLIVGFWSSGKQGLSSLLLSCYSSPRDARAGRHLRYCGKVGTGFGATTRESLRKALLKLRQQKPACEGAIPRGQGLVWCRPAIVAEVQFSEWTQDGALRHPVFIGLRSDKSIRDIIHTVTGAARS